MSLPIGVERPCKGCNSVIDRKKFCTSACRDSWYARTSRERETAKRRANGALPLNEWKAIRRAKAERQCDRCGTQFMPTGGGPNKFCSPACFSVSVRVYATRSERKKAEHERARIRRGGLSREERKAQTIKAAETKEQTRLSILASHVCRDCGANISDRGLSAVLCVKCADSNARAYRKAWKAGTRLRDRSQRIEKFDPVEVLERDGWKCHLCGGKTPKSLRGTYEPNAPELDHIIPLAKGGEHSRSNTACACRRCNIAKSDRPLGQIRLFG